jgi:hypothetical protein
MNSEEIMEMAREAGAYEDFAFKDEYFDMSRQALERFYNLAIAKEREACAKLCDEFCYGSTKILIERAIRARGEA